MSSPALNRWLEQLEQRSPASRIDLGLERVSSVWQKLGIDLSDRPVITVAGTNGKGSVVAFCESMMLAAGYRPFGYTSPHLLSFAERMHIGGRPAGADAIVAALESVEGARGQVPLTWFEHVTLSGLVLAARSDVDVLVLEVGLGGRLDAVNIIDADVAVITSIGLDHVEWLGTTRSAIAREKAGIARPGRPAVVGERRPPDALAGRLAEIGAIAVLAGRDFNWRRGDNGFRLQLTDREIELPLPALEGSWQLGNASCAVVALSLLSEQLSIDDAAFAAGLAAARIPGRMQRFGQHPEIIADVAHNGPAARTLASVLGRPAGNSYAVFSALEGKNVGAIGKALDRCFTHWLVAPLAGDRGRLADAIVTELAAIPVSGVAEAVESVPRALGIALERASANDRIVVFGSFRTVAEAWPTLNERI